MQRLCVFDPGCWLQLCCAALRNRIYQAERLAASSSWSIPTAGFAGFTALGSLNYIASQRNDIRCVGRKVSSLRQPKIAMPAEILASFLRQDFTEVDHKLNMSVSSSP